MPVHVQCDTIKSLKVEVEQMKEKFEKLERTTEKHDEEITELKTNHAETKVYVKQILEKIGSLEDRLFTYLTRVTESATKERLEDRKYDLKERAAYTEERLQSTTNWQNLIKYVIGATIGVLIAGVAAYLKN